MQSIKNRTSKDHSTKKKRVNSSDSRGTKSTKKEHVRSSNRRREKNQETRSKYSVKKKRNSSEGSIKPKSSD
jgi:hypothetical protein